MTVWKVTFWNLTYTNTQLHFNFFIHILNYNFTIIYIPSLHYIDYYWLLLFKSMKKQQPNNIRLVNVMFIKNIKIILQTILHWEAAAPFELQLAEHRTNRSIRYVRIFDIRIPIPLSILNAHS